jgi:hypothetical protein
VKGTVITADEVKARWGYAEITSERFGKSYKKNLPEKVYRAATNGEPFSNVPSSEWQHLIAALIAARNADFIGSIDRFGAPKYVCGEWEADTLLKCRTLHCFGAVRYFQFVARPPEKGDEYDPRSKSHQIPFDDKFKIEEPLISILVDGSPTLIEGYLRSILWLRNPEALLRIWVPKLK